MASIQSKKSKSGKITYYVVIPLARQRKWIKAGTKKEAQTIKRQLEGLENSQRLEKLGLVVKPKKIDQFFEEYTDHVRLHCSPTTAKRYLTIINIFIVFLSMFHKNIKHLSQVKPETIESFQKRRLTSIELKINVDGDRIGTRKNKKLPLPQTVNYEVNVLRSAFIWAKEHDWISQVPTQNIKKLKPQYVKKAKILSPKECKIFLDTAKRLSERRRGMLLYYRAFFLYAEYRSQVG